MERASLEFGRIELPSMNRSSIYSKDDCLSQHVASHLSEFIFTGVFLARSQRAIHL